MGKITEYLVEQSAKPKGPLGGVMMRIMNRAYLPMARWALGLLPAMDTALPPEILDIGMGNGATSALLAKQYAGSAVWGVDISESAVKAAKKKYPEIHFLLGDICAGLPAGDGSFGLACAFQTHFHWGDIPAGFAQTARLLAPGGVFLVAFESVKQDYFAKELREVRAVIDLVRGAGFAGVDIRQRGGWTAWLIKR